MAATNPLPRRALSSQARPRRQAPETQEYAPKSGRAVFRFGRDRSVFLPVGCGLLGSDPVGAIAGFELPLKYFNGSLSHMTSTSFMCQAFRPCWEVADLDQPEII